MANITQTTVLEDLSYMLGEQSVPTSGIEDRKRFIQRALERIYRAYNFDEFKAIATLAVTANGDGTYMTTLPSDIGETPDLDARVINSGSNDDYIFTAIPYEDQDKYETGDYKYWLTGSSEDYTLHTKDSISQLIIRYTQTAPTINASIATEFPSSMAIARGALVYYKQAENPLADVTQDEGFFQRELDEVISRQNRNRPKERIRSIQEMNNEFTGRV